jgi:hypothetical protein
MPKARTPLISSTTAERLATYPAEQEIIGPIDISAAQNHHPFGDTAEHFNERRRLLLCECNAIDHHVRANASNIVAGPLELIAIAMNDAHPLWRIGGTGVAVKDRDLVSEKGQPPNNLLPDETRSA